MSGGGSKQALAILQKIIKPWQITGVASTPDYLEYFPPAHEYRRFAPGSQPRIAIIPSDVPKYIYDIKYYVRDFRRNSKYEKRLVNPTGGFDFNKLFADAPLKPEDIKYTPHPEFVQIRGS